MLSIAALKQHVEDWARGLGLTVEHDYYQVVKKFAEFVEGKQAVTDAVDLLRSKGYTVVNPPASANQQAAA